jgi:hypothetical protein
VVLRAALSSVHPLALVGKQVLNASHWLGVVVPAVSMAIGFMSARNADALAFTNVHPELQDTPVKLAPDVSTNTVEGELGFQYI